MYRRSQLIASSDIKVSLQNGASTIVIHFADSCDIDSLMTRLRSDRFPSGNTLSLHFENIIGNDLLPVIDIYLNLARENAPGEKNYVGSMASYGLSESSSGPGEQEGAGQHRIFEAGEVFGKVQGQSNWSNKQFRLTLIPSRSLPVGAAFTIGRIALYFNEG